MWNGYTCPWLLFIHLWDLPSSTKDCQLPHKQRRRWLDWPVTFP